MDTTRASGISRGSRDTGACAASEPRQLSRSLLESSEPRYKELGARVHFQFDLSLRSLDKG